MKVHIAFALFVAVISYTHGAGLTCMKTSPSPPGSRKMPTLPEQFSTHIEANFVDQMATMDLTEYYDFPNNRGMIIMYQQGMNARVVYNYDTNELITFISIPGDDGTIVQRSCDIQPLNATTDDLVKVFSTTVNMGNRTTRIYSVKEVFNFGGPSADYVYVNQTTVRGITVDQFYWCGMWSDKRSTVEVNWYYSADGDSGWSSAQLTSVPVRAHVRGHIINEEGTGRDIEHVYEFYEFMFKLPDPPKDEQLFQIPPMSYCSTKVNTKPFPDLTYFPLYFSALAEIVNPVKNSIAHAEIKYDQVYNMARFETSFGDLDTNPEAAQTYGSMVMIQDFNTGVQYTIKKQTGECTIQTIDPTLGDSKLAVDQIQMVRIDTVLELLRLNQTAYTYSGKRECRQATCDVYVMLRDDWPYDNTDKTQTIWEWYFLADDWTQLGTSVPMMVVISQLNKFAGPLDAKYNQRVSFINWDAEDEPDIFGSYSDIAMCFTTSDQQKHLRFELPAIDNKGLPVTVDIKSLKFNILDAIIGQVDISPIRIYDLQVEYELGTERILVTFTLLDRAPEVGGVDNPIPEMSVEEATKMINSTINTGKFTVALDTNPEEPQLLNAIPVSLVKVIRMKIPCPNKTEIVVPDLPTTLAPTPTTSSTSNPPSEPCVGQQTTDQSLGTGAVAGIAVGSAVGGALIAFVVFFLIQWRLRNREGGSTFPMMRFK